MERGIVMRNRRLNTALICLCLLLTATLHATAATLPQSPFAYADLTAGGVPAGATVEQTVAILGEPAQRGEATTEAATGDTLQTLTYEGLTLTYTNGLLTGALLTSAAVAGPRGIRLGMDEAALNAAFPYDQNAAKDGVLYAAGWVDALGLPLPPCAKTMTYDDGTAIVQYLSPVAPYSAEVLASPEAFLYEAHAGLAVTFGTDKVITALEWHVGALAE